VILKNPARDVLTFDENIDIKNVKIFSLLGQIMLDLPHPKSNLDISKLPNGVYVVLIQTDQQVYKEKLIIEQ
jgi:hypothetical protein